jgi:hypothetical protein
MVDPSGEGKTIGPSAPSNKRMRQYDKVGPLVWAAIFSTIFLGLGIFRFGDVEDRWAYIVDSDFIIVNLDLQFDWC